MLSCAVIVPDRTPLDFHTNVAVVVPLLATPMPDPVVVHPAMPRSIAGRRAALIAFIFTSTSCSMRLIVAPSSVVAAPHGATDLLRPSHVERRSWVSRKGDPGSDLSQPATGRPG